MRPERTILKRLIIYPKDIKNIIGKSYNTAWILWQEIHAALNKSDHQVISIREFCEYMGLEEKLVLEFLK